MGILNEEELNKKLDRYVLFVSPKEDEFKKRINNRCVSPLLIDPMLEANMEELANASDAGYIDLSVVTSYEALSEILRLHPDGIVLDNIDSIPDSEDKEYIEQTVRYALKKEEDTPLAKDQWLDFSKIKVGARSRKYPEYIEDVYNYIYKIEIEK